MQGRKSKEESEMTSDEQPMDPPSKLASRGVYSERKEERIGLAEQIANVQEQTFELSRSLQKEKHNTIKVTLTFLIVFVLVYMYASLSEQNDIKLIRDSIQQLQSRDLEWRKETLHLEKTITAMQEEIGSLQKYISRLEDELTDIYLSELQKPQKSFRFLMKYSNGFPLQFDSSNNFKRHYKQTKNKGHRLRKTTNQQIVAYSEQAIGEEDVQHFQVKIEETELGMVAIGVFTESKNKTCGFCQSDKMYYIYAKNGKIYHGETLQYYKHSVDTAFNSIGRGDIVTVFVNNQQKEIIWYVNSKYAGTKYLQPSDQAERLHPFILMNSRGDQIAITSDAPTSS